MSWFSNLIDKVPIVGPIVSGIVGSRSEEKAKDQANDLATQQLDLGRETNAQSAALSRQAQEFELASAREAMAFEKQQSEYANAFSQASADKAMSFSASEAEKNRAFQQMSADKAMIFSQNSAREQMDFQEKMSNTQIQRMMADAKAAGVNPLYLVGHGGAGNLSGSSASGSSAGGSTASAFEASGRSASGRTASGRVANLENPGLNLTKLGEIRMQSAINKSNLMNSAVSNVIQLSKGYQELQNLKTEQDHIKAKIQSTISDTSLSRARKDEILAGLPSISAQAENEIRQRSYRESWVGEHITEPLKYLLSGVSSAASAAVGFAAGRRAKTIYQYKLKSMPKK